MLTVVTDDNAHANMAAALDEIVREGAHRMLAAERIHSGNRRDDVPSRH